MINDTFKAIGEVSIVLTDEHGNVKSEHKENLVVAAGKAYIASRMRDASAAVISHMGVGTDTTAAASGQTGLIAQSARVALSSTASVTTTVTGDATQYVASFPPGTATAALTEAGLFNAATAGTMLARTVFPVINKGNLDTLTITWKVTIA